MSSKKCTLQHQQHGQKMASKQVASPSLNSSNASVSPNSISLADQLNIFRVLSNHSTPPSFPPLPIPQQSFGFPATSNFMPFAMPQYAALLQSAANMAANYNSVNKKNESEKRFSASSLFDGAKTNFVTPDTVKIFQQFLAQQVNLTEPFFITFTFRSKNHRKSSLTTI
jgi:hypothetical protein